jgi:polysaccharide biosynthesis transport protein
MDASKIPTQTDSRLHFLDYWRIIRLRKVVIITVLLLVVITTTVVTYVLQPTYASTAQIRVERDTPDISLFNPSSSQPTFDYYFYSTEYETLRSEKILYPVIERLELGKLYAEHFKLPEVLETQRVYEYLSRDVEAKQSRSTSLIDITAESWDKNLAAKIANEIAKSYEEYRSSTRASRFVNGLTTLTNVVHELKDNLDRQTKEVDSLKLKLNVPDIVSDVGQFQSLGVEEMQLLQKEQTTFELQLSKEEGELNRLLNLERTSPDDLRHTLNFMHPTPLLQSLLADLSLAEQREVSTLHDLGPEHPDVKRSHDLVAKVNSQIDKETKGILDSLSSIVATTRTNFQKVKEKLETARSEDTKNLGKWRPYLQAKKDLESKQKTYETMNAYLIQQSADVAISRESSVVLINQARPALRPIKPNKLVNITLGGAFGLLLGVGLAFFIEYLDTSVKTIDDVEQALQASVLGVIPQNVGSLLIEGPESPHSEAYRVLRTNILFSRKDPNLRAITVVSGGAGEGKSTTIFNLAVIFAQQGSRVLLVDSDLRRPTLHKLFNVSNTNGLTSFLMKQMKLEEAIQTSQVPNLHFMPSGKLPSSSMGILNSAAMRTFIEEAKSRYDFVFFDSPPIMGVSDASILASEVDMAILVVQYRKYPQQMTLRAKQMVEKVGGRMLGVVLNNINISQDSYYYYYSGYYYDYYSKSEDSRPDSDEKGDGKTSVSKGGDGKGDLGLKGKF